jgi:Tol biopolymer transport system component
LLIGMVVQILSIAPDQAAPIVLVSHANPTSNTAPGSGYSDAGQVSANGRFVAFESLAANLTLIAPAQQALGGYVNIYVRDLVTGQTELMSVNQAGTQGGGGDSTNPSISGDGRYVVFESEADDLVNGDTNGVSDVFVRDRQTGQTTLVSARSDGHSGNGPSGNASITPGGRYVAFESDASDLAADDPNKVTDVFLRDLQTGTLTRVSAGSQGPASFAYSIDASLSADGQAVAFLTSASYPSLGVTSIADKIAIFDVPQNKLTVLTPALLQAAAQAQGIQGTVPPNSSAPAISADGQSVTFKNESWLFLYDRSAAKLSVVATNAYAVDSGDDETGPFISADGQKVLYAAVVGDQVQIMVWDRKTQQMQTVSANAHGDLADSSCDSERMSADGRRVVFVSDATNLVPGVTNGTFQVYWRDLSTNSIRLVGVAPEGGPGASVEATIPSISADGNVVTFDAGDGPLVPDDNNHDTDVFAVDMTTAIVSLVSARHPALPCLSGNLASSAPLAALSLDGQRAIFLSWSDNLAGTDSNQAEDVFAYDLSQQRVMLVSATPGAASGDAGGNDAILSADGRIVVFSSPATNLTSVVDTNGAPDLFWRNIDTSETQVLTTSADGKSASMDPSGSPVSGSASVSQDGQRVAFVSSATNLVNAPTSPGALNLLLRDIPTQSTKLIDQGNVGSPVISPDGTRILYWKQPAVVTAPPIELWLWDASALTNRLILAQTNTVVPVAGLSMSAAWDVGVFEASLGDIRAVYWVRLSDGSHGSVSQVSDGVETTNTGASAPLISGNGGFVVFTSMEPRYTGGTQAMFKQVFVRNLQSNQLALVSANQAGLPGDGDSKNAVISQDGRYVAFESDADDLVPNDTNQVTDVFLRDMVDKKTSVVSVAATGEAGNAASLRPWLNAAGDIVLFTSVASNLVPGDYNQDTDVFIAQLAAPYIESAKIQQSQFTLQFSSRAGRKYRIDGTSDVVTGPWALVQEVTATDSSTTVSVPMNGVRQFYRVSLEP